MTTPFGRQYLNAYLNQGNFFNFNALGTSYGQIFGTGYSSNYSCGAATASFAMGIASSIFTNVLMNKVSNANNGGGYNTYEQALDSLDKQIERLENTDPETELPGSYNKKIQEADRRVTTAQSNVTKAENNLSTACTNYENANSELQKLKNASDEEKQAPTYETQLKLAEEKVARAKAEYETLSGNASVKGSVEYYKAELTNAEAEKKAAEEAKEEKIAEIQAEINASIDELKAQKEKLEKDNKNHEDNYMLNKADGNVLQRIGGKENAEARQLIRNFRKAKLDYDKDPSDTNRNALTSALNAVKNYETNNLNKEVKQGIEYIQNYTLN